MKFKTLFTALLLFTAWQTLTSSLRDPNNPPTAKTGAPGETTCAQSGCHNGGSYTGSVSVTGIPDTVLPNNIYTLTITNASNAVRAGFQCTCLDAANTRCGTLTAGTGCSIGSSNGRQYVRQSSPKTLSNGSISWNFNWKAPATLASSDVTFYFVSLAANGNGQSTGDNVLLGTKKVVFNQAVTATYESAMASQVRLYPSPAKDAVQLDLPKGETGALRLFDAQGNMVLQNLVSDNNQLNVSHLPRGLYIAKIELKDGLATKRLLLQ